MKNRKRISLNFLMICAMFIFASVFYASISFATTQQETNINNKILVEAISLNWINGYGENISEIELPLSLSPGEVIPFNGGNISLTHQGEPCYVRVKLITEINNAHSDLVKIDLLQYENQDVWIKGNDDYYYYCYSETGGIMQSPTHVASQISFSDNIKKDISNQSVKIKVVAEGIDTTEGTWRALWGIAPPEEWFLATTNAIN